MESLLLNDDDSSSGESDTEVPVGSGTTRSTTHASAPVPALPPPAAPAPSTAAPLPPTSSQSEINQRLKSVYYASNKNKPPQQAQVTQPPVSRPAPTISKGISHQVPHPQQQQPSGRHPPPTMSSQQQPRPNSMPVQQQQRPQMPQSQSRSTHSIPPPGPPHRGKSNDPYEPTPVSKILERQQQKAKAAQRAAMSAAPPSSSRPLSYPSSRQVPPPSGTRPSYPPHQAAAPKTSRPSQPTYSSQPSGPRQPQPSSRPSQSTSRPYQTPATTSSQKSSSSSVSTLPTSNVSSDPRTLSEAERKKQKEKFLIFTRVLMKYLEQKDPPLHVKVKAIIKGTTKLWPPGADLSEQYINHFYFHLQIVPTETRGRNADTRVLRPV